MEPSSLQFAIGVLGGTLLDVLWWKRGLSKYEYGRLSWLEHYHFALVLLMVSLWVEYSWLLIGVATMLIIAEWSEPLSGQIEKHPLAI